MKIAFSPAIAFALACMAFSVQGVELFNGKDLTGWYKFLQGSGRDNDPKGVISVTNGVIRITGEIWGALVSEAEYSDYRLDVEYRWTGKKWPSKAKCALDSGILFHSTGPDGGFGGIWMFSHELNVIFGATGDIWTVGSRKSRPDMFVKSTARRVTNGNRSYLVYDPKGEEVTLTGNMRLARLDIDPSWEDSPTARAAANEHPVGEWNTATLVCRGAETECWFNGKFVNRATVSPSRGRIQLQSEGCEIEYRRVTLTPLTDGRKKYECRDGVCYLVEDATTNFVDKGVAISGSGETGKIRIAQGYMPAEKFVAFLEGRETDSLAGYGIWVMLLLVLLGGLAMNLTPCVLPMVPINLMIIGRSAKRGLTYGLGIALAYGLLGVGAAVGGLAFGDIQGSPWFNAAVAVVFAGLALALFDVFFIDFSRFRSSHQAPGTKHSALLFAFFMGAMSAVLAGACVAPVLVSVLLLTTDLVAKGNRLAILLPFVMGIGMAFPWPFAGAGMKVLPKPGGWMKGVNRAFGVIVLGFAAWYGNLAWQGFRSLKVPQFESLNVSSQTFKPSNIQTLLAQATRPVLVDCWATWCKNCAAMDAVMKDEKVRRALEPFEVIRVQAEDVSELKKVKGFESIKGLPAFVIFE